MRASSSVSWKGHKVALLSLVKFRSLTAGLKTATESALKIAQILEGVAKIKAGLI